MSVLAAVPGLTSLLTATVARRTTLPAQYTVEITHQRAAPIRYGFTTSSRTWLVDVDAEDARPHSALVRFDAADHFRGDAPTLRAGIETFLAGQGVPAPTGTITMLANPRVLGYVFNPLSVFWCHDADGATVAVVAEVHNTYGERHAYLLPVDDAGRGETDKAFYVSPFYPVDGRYRMSVPEPHDDVAVVVTLHRDGERPFVASLRGHRLTAGPTPLRRALRTPLLTRGVMAGIKRHGITLYLKGLRVAPRPPVPTQEGVSRP